MDNKVAMEGLPTCANCLSIARDAKAMGIDVDGPQNDKGLVRADSYSQSEFNE